MEFKELIFQIIGCAINVHNALGSGFQEVICQRALSIEMTKQHLQHRREMEMTTFYDGIELNKAG